MNQPNSTILCIDDDKDNCELLTFVFNLKGYRVETYQNPAEGLSRARQENFSAIILDNHLSGISGLELCREIKLFRPFVPVIFFSGESRQAEIDEALAAGANAYFVKPVDFEELPEAVIKIVKDSRIKHQAAAAK